MKTLLFLLSLIPVLLHSQQQSDTGLRGAWSTPLYDAEGEAGELIMIIADGFFVMTTFDQDTSQSIYTTGGSYAIDGEKFVVTYEFDNQQSAKVGTTQAIPFTQTGSMLAFNNGEKAWARIDDGSSPLAGAWVFGGRRGDDGQIERREGPLAPRRTMKMLSGERFQWIAYNTEATEVVATGGGSYTAEDDTYSEKIEFFSRDASRVGAELNFDYEIKDGEWHHSGNNSRGEPMYEIWTKREEK